MDSTTEYELRLALREIVRLLKEIKEQNNRILYHVREAQR